MVWVRKRNVGARHQQIIGKSDGCHTAVPRRDMFITTDICCLLTSYNQKKDMKKVLQVVGVIHALTCFISSLALAQTQFGWTEASNATVHTRTDRVPAGAFKASYNGPTPGFDSLYVCRAEYQNGVHPGKLFDRWCNIGWGGKELRFDEYEVLVTASGGNMTLIWLPSATGKPKPATNMVYGGSLDSRSEGYPLYVCRAEYRGGLHPGQYRVDKDKCFIGWGGKEVSFQEYEVLTWNAR